MADDPHGSVTMSPVDPSATLGVLVADRPARASLFERLRLEYCCGGRQTLAEACKQRGLEIDSVRAALETLDAESVKPEGFEDTDWRRAGIAELCAHIVLVHHDGLRDAFPKIEALLSTVVRVHGAGHPELRDLQRAFAGIRAELELHIASEPHTAERLVKRRGDRFGVVEVRYEPRSRGFATFRSLGGNTPWPPSQAYSPIT